MSERTVIEAKEGPAAIGPYSHAVSHGGLLYCSGALPLDPTTSELVDSSAGAETERCLANLEAVCAAAGTGLSASVLVTVYATDLDRFGEINDAYGAFFEVDPPARVTVGVAALPKGARVEIAAIVALDP